MIDVTPELLARHDRPGPRYTSYPTAVEFTDAVGPDDYARLLATAATTPAAPLSLYVHLPFCEARCSFCACHVVVARHPDVADAYLGRVLAEADLVAARLGDRRRVVQYHWGGGTPTFYPPDTLARLHTELTRRFPLDAGAEVALEADPRVTTPEHLAVLADLGFTRVSFGVQDVDVTVQELIGRHQTPEQTESLYAEARRLGFGSINLDLVYGLPGQSEASLDATLDTVLRLRPDRLAVYSFAFLPESRTHQKRIDASRIPNRDVKFALLALIVTRLTAAGYRHVGMDHFSLPSDELTVAADEGTLTRNFMGYTTKRGTDVVALGSSGIGDLAGAYVQGHRRLASYYAALDAGRLPVERGVILDADDRLRREVVTEIMCNSRVDLAAVSARHGVDGGKYFGPELETLTAPGGLVEEGMAAVEGGLVSATELGRLFIRRVAAVFDAYATRRRGQVFSTAV